MTAWQELLGKDGRLPEWPYPISYDKEQTVETDVLRDRAHGRLVFHVRGSGGQFL